MVSCNLRPALLAEWACPWDNAEVEQTPNRSQRTKLTLEKKILPPLLPGIEPATFRLRVRRCTEWSIPKPLLDIQDVLKAGDRRILCGGCSPQYSCPSGAGSDDVVWRLFTTVELSFRSWQWWCCVAAVHLSRAIFQELAVMMLCSGCSSQ